jgi:hypothetical protein
MNLLSNYILKQDTTHISICLDKCIERILPCCAVSAFSWPPSMPVAAWKPFHEFSNWTTASSINKLHMLMHL